MKRIGLAYQDEHRERARLHGEIVDDVNELVGQTVEVKTPASANTEFSVRHPGLGHVAREIHILSQDVGGAIYRSNVPKWTPDVSFLKYTQGGGHSILLRVR